MAFCPECMGAMASVEIVCPHCGYDFPDVQGSKPRTGFAYSVLADAALVVSMIAAGLGSVLTALATVAALLAGELITAVMGVIGVFLQLGMLVVFLRVSDLTK